MRKVGTTQKQKERRGLRLNKRILKLERVLERIKTWAQAYPLDVFPEPDFKKAAEVLKENNLSLDVISASNIRHVLEGVIDIIKESTDG